MDPFSLTVGTIALIGFTRKILLGLQALESLSQIPDDIAALIDELQDFHNIVATIYVILEQSVPSKSQGHDAEKLKPLLVKASDIIVAIAAHCGISIQEDPTRDLQQPQGPLELSAASSKIDLLTRFRWLKDQKKIAQFRQRLKVVRIDIANHLASLNLLNSYSILAEVKDIAVICRRMSIQSDSISEPRSIAAEMSSSDTTSEKGIMFPDRMTEEPTKSAELTPYRRPSDTPPPYEADPGLEMSNCNCACHNVTTFQTPRAMKPLFGSLKLRVEGLPYFTSACDQILCRKNNHSSMKAAFRLPTWFSDRTLNTHLSSGHVMGPQLNLFQTRTVCRTSDVFWYAMQGDIPGIKRLFSKGLASPYDVTHNYGYSALHYAASYNHLALCDFLVKTGAKTDIQDFDNKTPTDIAYNKLVASTSPIPEWSGERVQEVFDEESWLEHKQLTSLHQIVLGVARSSRTIADELSISVKEINIGDCDGRTALSWAAERGDVEAAKVLLKFGASHDIGDNDGNTPVHYACKSESATGPAVLTTLLDAGASPIKRNKWKQTPLNWVSFFQDDPQYIKCLQFHPAVSIHGDTDHYGSTLIGNAAFKSHANMLEYLLDSGSDPNAGLEAGESPLLDCISKNNHKCLEVLLRKSRASNLLLSWQDWNNETCLHYIARRADLETIRLFTHALENDQLDVSGLRSSHVGKDGLTPRNILTLRNVGGVKGPSAEEVELSRAMERFLVLVERETASEIASATSSTSADEAVFVNAFDYLPDLEKDAGVAVCVREISLLKVS